MSTHHDINIKAAPVISSLKVTVAVTVLKESGFEPQLLVQLVILVLLRHSKVYVDALDVKVIPEISVILPKTLQAVLVVHVGVFVAPVQLQEPIRGMS